MNSTVRALTLEESKRASSVQTLPRRPLDFDMSLSHIKMSVAPLDNEIQSMPRGEKNGSLSLQTAAIVGSSVAAVAASLVDQTAKHISGP